MAACWQRRGPGSFPFRPEAARPRTFRKIVLDVPHSSGFPRLAFQGLHPCSVIAPRATIPACAANGDDSGGRRLAAFVRDRAADDARGRPWQRSSPSATSPSFTTTASTDAFTFVFLRDVEAGTIVNFTDNGWLAAGGFRPGEDTVTYTAPSAITAGTIVTLSGLDLDAAGDQIIAYQGDPATPTILHLVDFGDGNNTVAGDATDDNTTALPPGFTLGVNAVAVAFDNSLYAGPTSGSPDGVVRRIEQFGQLARRATRCPCAFVVNAKPTIDLDSDNSTHSGLDYETSVASGGPAVPIADIDIAIDDDDGFDIFAAEIRIMQRRCPGTFSPSTARCPPESWQRHTIRPNGILRLEGQASHADYETAIRQVEFSTTDAPGRSKVSRSRSSTARAGVRTAQRSFDVMTT